MAIRKSSNTGIPFGNTSGRPSSPGTGQPYFNGELQRLELYTGATYGWQNIVAETPGVTGYTGTVSETSGGTITVTGSNFAAGATASLIGTDGTEYFATTTTVSNLNQISATFGAISASLEPYDLKVTNPSNLYGVYYDIVTVNDKPIWQTSAGSLGSFYSNTSISTSVLSVSDEEDNTISYSLNSGSTLPSGMSLNSSTGVISGTLPSVLADTTYTFTINASDGINSSQSRIFSITSLNTLNVVNIFRDNSSKLFYKLDSDFTDSVGNASSFTTSNVSFTTGKIDNAATYNGSSSTSYKDVSDILTGSGDRSYSLWSYINSGATGRQLLFGQGNFGTSNQNFDFEANCYHNSTISDSYGIHWWGNGIKFDNATTIYDQWVHLVVTQSGGTISPTNTKLYINGVQKTLNNYTTSSYSIPTNSRICIGTRTYSGGSDLYSNGKIDQIRVFNKVLSQSEIDVLYSSGSGA